MEPTFLLEKQKVNKINEWNFKCARGKNYRKKKKERGESDVTDK